MSTDSFSMHLERKQIINLLCCFSYVWISLWSHSTFRSSVFPLFLLFFRHRVNNKITAIVLCCFNRSKFKWQVSYIYFRHAYFYASQTCSLVHVYSTVYDIYKYAKCHRKKMYLNDVLIIARDTYDVLKVIFTCQIDVENPFTARNPNKLSATSIVYTLKIKFDLFTQWHDNQELVL